MGEAEDKKRTELLTDALQDILSKMTKGEGMTLSMMKTAVLDPKYGLSQEELPDSKDLWTVLTALQKKNYVAKDSTGTYYWTGPKDTTVMASLNNKVRMDQAVGCQYHDHENVLPALDMFYKMKIPTLVIGPHGTGKTDAIREYCRQKGLNMYTVPCSLGLREHNFIGRLDKREGNVVFKKGPVPMSMEDEHGVLYLDELNAAEADVLLRLDEVLDGRKEVNIEGTVVKASPNWWCVASINPLDHAGTKELPNQLLSRFSHRIYLGYPKKDSDEITIVYKANGTDPSTLDPMTTDAIGSVVQCVRQLRDATLELPYNPSLRESISCAKLIILGMPLRLVVKHVILTPYYQWGTTTVDKVADFLTSRLGAGNVEK